MFGRLLFTLKRNSRIVSSTVLLTSAGSIAVATEKDQQQSLLQGMFSRVAHAQSKENDQSEDYRKSETVKEALARQNPFEGLEPHELMPAKKTKRVVLLGESHSSLLVAYSLLNSAQFRDSDHKVFLVHEKGIKENEEAIEVDYSQMNTVKFFFSWIRDPRANRVQEIHGYRYLMEKLRRLVTSKLDATELRQLKQLLSEEKGDARLTLTDGDILVDGKTALRQWLEEQAAKDGAKIEIIDGGSALLLNFGSRIGNAEVDAVQVKSVRGDVFVHSCGRHILRTASAIGLKTSILQMSSSLINQERLFNGPVTYRAPDACPINGRSCRHTNLVYNFGASNALFDGDAKQTLALHVRQAEMAAQEAMTMMGIETQLGEQEQLRKDAYSRLMNAKRYNL